mgnify:CR=1 FL=1
MSMYAEYFGLAENPFSIAPDPRYLYLSDQHREALAHLLFGISSDGGFVLLTGEVGTGKTTICRCLLEQLPEDCDLAFIFNPKLTVLELLSTICDEFKIAYPPQTQSIKVFVDLINQYLLDAHAQKRKALLIIDEAQNLHSDVLEQIRLLTNLETHQRKLLQVILLGQPELRHKLAQPELRQLAQRVIARYHLGPLNDGEVSAYVYHRLKVAGSRRPLFPAPTLAYLHRLSGGIPRLINVLCDRALLGCYVQGKESVDKATLATAAREVFGEPPSSARRFHKALPWALAALLLLVSGALVVAAYLNYLPTREKTKISAVGAAEKVPETAPESSPRPPTPAIKRQLPNPSTTDSKPGPPLGSTMEQPGALPQATAAVATQAAQEEPATTEAIPTPAAPQEVVSFPSEAAKPSEPGPGSPPAQTTAPLVQPAKLSWPAEQPIANSRLLAMEALFQLWGASFKAAPGQSAACQQAEAQGLACLSGKGGLDDLRRYNRPALLKLYTEQGAEFYATLTSIDGQHARFSVGGAERIVPIEEIALRWLGDYLLLWRPPPHYQGVVQMGGRGPMVEWLQQSLPKVLGEAEESFKGAVFSEQMAHAVKKFQLINGLQPDGMVGPQTLILLDMALKPEPPLLVR